MLASDPVHPDAGAVSIRNPDLRNRDPRRVLASLYVRWASSRYANPASALIDVTCPQCEGPTTMLSIVTRTVDSYDFDIAKYYCTNECHVNEFYGVFYKVRQK